MTAAPAKREETKVVRRRRLRPLRWAVVLLMFVAILVLLAVGAVQLVLTSDVPRATLVRELQRETGLRFEAGSSRTRWGGETELRDVSVALPLEDEPFLRIPLLRVEHTALLRLAVRGFEVHEATMEAPHVRLRQDELGRWNALRAVEIVQARQAHAAPSGEVPPLPRVNLRAGVVEIPGPDGERVEFPLDIAGEPDGSLAWAFTVAVGDALAARGRIAPGGEWQHEVQVVFGEDQTLFDVFAPAELLPLRGTAVWRGGIENDELTGRLSLDRVQAGGFRARGDAGFSASNGRIAVRPRGIIFGESGRPELEARIVSGSIVLDGAIARMQRLLIEGGGAVMQVNGYWDLDSDAGEIIASWSGTMAGPILAHEGEARIEATLPEVGAASLRADVRTSGRVEQGSWTSEVNVTGRGASWEQLVGEITAERLVWSDEQGDLDLSGAMARLESEWPIVRLNRITIPGAERARINGWLDASALTWRLDAEASQWNMPRVRGGALDMLMRAEGDATRVRVPELRIAGSNFDARVSGDYDLQQEVPLRAAARVAYRLHGDERGRPENTQLQAEAGAWLAQMQVSGGIDPLNLRMDGELLGRDVRVGDAPVEHVSIPFSGNATEDGAEFSSGQFDLLGGAWKLQGRYVDLTRSLALQLDAETVPLQGALQIVDVPLELPGVANGRVQVLVPGLDLDAMQIQGGFDVAGIDRPGLVIEHGRGEIVAQGGVLTLRGLEMVAGDARLTGSLEYNLQHREDVHLDIETHSWPLSIEGVPVTAVMDGRAVVSLGLADMMLRGRVDAAADVAHLGEPLGRLSTLSVLDGRRVDIRRVQGNISGGTVDGSGMVWLDDLLRSSGELTLEGVDVAALMRCLDIDDEFAGTVGVQVRLGPADEARAPEPLALAIDMTSTNASFRTVSVGNAEIRAFFGPQRSVLDRSTIGIADGVLTLWSRISQHGDEQFVHVQANVAAIDIDQLYRAVEPEGGELPGRLSGQAAFGGYPFAEDRRLFGEARLALIDSDLANLPIISTVYNLLNLRMGPQQPRGKGEVRVRLEGDAVEIYRMNYFNRGADVGASLRIHDIQMGGDSPISGVAAGTIRPLRDLTIPFVDVDRMLGALQTGAASVEIGGTLEDREVRVVPFAEIAGRFMRILGGN